MGYSSRYHAASLAAVFLALAVGILIGVGFGSDIVSGTADDLEASLASDLDDARAQADELEAELDAERDYSTAVYPAVVAGDLEGDRVALIGLGGLDAGLADSIEAAVEPAGATLAEVAVVRVPPDLDSLASLVQGNRSRAVSRGGDEELLALAERAGRRLVRGGAGFDALRGTLLSRFSGAPGGIDGVVVVRQRPSDLEPGEEVTSELLEGGLIDGLDATAGAVVGAEAAAADPSAIEFFEASGLASIDSVDRIAGKVALVYALDGAAGSFGIKETADSLLPDLLPAGRDDSPAPGEGQRDRPAGGGSGADEPG